MATGSSSPASAQSKASLSTAALPPTEVNTVLRLTSARAAMASIVVGPYPRSTYSSPPARTMRRRVAWACSSRSLEWYGRSRTVTPAP